MANKDYTYDGILTSGIGYFQYEASPIFSASVKRMQYKLNRLGYSCGTPDGLFGTNTDTKVRAFQTAKGLTSDGRAGQKTLLKLETLSPDSTVEHYGRELTHTEWISGYSNSNISDVESLARTIFGEDKDYTDGEAAVAKEIRNRMITSRDFDDLTPIGKTWKGLVFSPGQYAVATGPSSETENARHPDQYSSQWANSVMLAQQLVYNQVPNSTLSFQCYHTASWNPYPSDAIVSTRIQIPANVGNKFYDKQTSL